MFNSKIVAFVLDVSANLTEIKKQLVEVVKSVKDSDSIYMKSGSDLTKGQAVVALTKYPFNVFSLYELIRDVLDDFSTDYYSDKLIIVITDKDKIDNFETRKMLKKIKITDKCDLKLFRLTKSTEDLGTFINTESIFDALIEHL